MVDESESWELRVITGLLRSGEVSTSEELYEAGEEGLPPPRLRRVPLVEISWEVKVAISALRVILPPEVEM